MTDGDVEFHCPKCGSEPDSQTELPAEAGSRIFKVRCYCKCGHSWTNNWATLDDSNIWDDEE